MTGPVQYPLIGLVGVKRSGKDTFASGLIERGYTRVAFADPLREMAEEIDPIVSARSGARLSHCLRAWGGWEGIKDSPVADEARRLLQHVGQAVRRNEPDYWLRRGLHAADDVEGPAVITDVRYRNEADAIQEAGGILVRIVRPGLVSTDTHDSETELLDYPVDFTVYNNDTAEALADLGRTIRF